MSSPQVIPPIFGQRAGVPAGEEAAPPPKEPESPKAGASSVLLKSARQAADDALAEARRDADALYGASRRTSGRSRCRSRTPPQRRRHSPSRAARSGRTDRGRDRGPRDVASSSRRRSPDNDGIYTEFYRASLKASSEDVHVGLLAQFFASTSQGKDRSSEVLGQIAARVRAWGVVLHDLYIFTGEGVKKYFAEDPVEGQGPSLSKALSHRGVVIEAVSLARALHAQHLPAADVGAFVGRLAGSGPRDSSSTSSARSRNKRRLAGLPPGPKASSGPDPLQKIAEGLGRLGDSGKKVHHFDSNPDKIHFDVTAVRSRPMGGDHSDIDPLSFLDHESISKFRHTFDSYR